MKTKKDNRPLTLQAYEELKKRIMDLHLRPGEILMIQTLSKDLGISRTPVREAVVRLEREGFVEVAEGKKFKVSPLTMRGVLEIHEIRKLMELHAVRQVAQNATKHQVKELNSTINRMKKALQQKSHDAFFESDLAFHQKIIQIHGNETLSQLMTQITDQIQRIRYLTTYIDRRLEETIGEHQDVLTAISEHVPDRAEERMAFHLNKVKDGLDKAFESGRIQFMGRMPI